MKKKKTTIEDLAVLIEKNSEDTKGYIKAEIQKNSEDTKKYVRQHVGGEIEKLAVLVVNRFDEVDDRLDKVDNRLDKVEGRLDGVEGGIKDLNRRITGIKYGQYELGKKLDITSTRFEISKVEARFEKRFQKIEAKIGIKQKTK